MITRFRRYIETGDWERFLDDDHKELTVFCWIAIIFSIVWFGPTIIQIMIYGPAK